MGILRLPVYTFSNKASVFCLMQAGCRNLKLEIGNEIMHLHASVFPNFKFQISNFTTSIINPLCCPAPHEFGPENIEIAVIRRPEQVDFFF